MLVLSQNKRMLLKLDEESFEKAEVSQNSAGYWRLYVHQRGGERDTFLGVFETEEEAKKKLFALMSAIDSDESIVID